MENKSLPVVPFKKYIFVKVLAIIILFYSGFQTVLFPLNFFIFSKNTNIGDFFPWFFGNLFFALVASIALFSKNKLLYSIASTIIILVLIIFFGFILFLFSKGVFIR